MSSRYFRTPPLSLAAQASGLRHQYPNGTTVAGRDDIGWRGELSPDAFGRTYDIEMHYRRDDKPDVWVRAPDLHAFTAGRRLPHVYDQKEQRLCLYVPGCGFWRPDRSFSQTILPWTCYWLRLFEMWLVTDTWHERGVHPEPRPRRSLPADNLRF